MKNFTSVLRSHSGAVQARIPSLRSVTNQKSTPPFCKVCRWLMVLLGVKAFAILCVLMFVALSVHATVVPDKYLTTKYLRYDASAKTYYWEVGYATSGNADFPEVLEFPTRLVDENDKDKKSYAIRRVSITLKEKTKKVIFHSGLTETFVSYESNSPIESIEYLGANTIAYIYLKNCKTIKEATLPKTLLRDGFINCTALEKVTFLEGCAEIPSLWFASCSALKTIVWPSTMKSIGDAAFEYAGLETLTLPEGFNSLGERCFKNSKLVNVVLPNSLTEIPREAFYNCRRLQTVQMSDNVTSIGVSAFDNCAYLTTMNMPLSIETIGNSAFSGCEAWKYEGEMKTPNLKSIGHSVFYLCSSLNCDYTVPHLWDQLPNSIFRCSGFKSLTLSEGITSIEHSAFLNSNTQTYNLPKSLKEIGTSAFREAYVKEVNFAPGTSLEKIDKYTFEKCIKLEAVNNIPSDLKVIEEYAFNGCYNLKALRLPEGLTTIGNNAFYGCKALESMNLPKSLTTLGTSAFYQCKMWDGEISLPLITDVPNAAFGACQKLRKVSFGPQLKSIGYSALSGCQALTELNLPNSLETIGSGAFSGCCNLTEVVIPESVTSIDAELFESCSALKKVTLPSGLTELPNRLFYACDVLNDIVIPTSVKTMGRGVFGNCTSLTRVVLPSTVNQFYGGNTFKDCPLTDIVCHAPTAPEAENYVFDAKHYSSTRLIVPEGSNYNDKYPWSRFNQKTEGEGFITLNNPVFSKESCTYTEPITVTITNPNASGTLYYKLVPEGTAKDEVEYAVFTEPLKLSEQSATIYAYIVDGINSSEYARMTYTYEPPVVKKVVLYVCGRLVDEKNAYDIFGDKTVSYDPKSEVLTLTWANIDATKFKASNIISGSGGDLTIRVVGHCTLKAPGTPIMYGHQLGVPGGSNLTIVGDENSILTVETTNEEKSGYSCGIDMYCGKLTIDNCTVVATGGTHGLYTKTGPEHGLTLRGKHALLNLTGTESAMDHVQRLDLDKMLMILEPEGAEFWDGSIWLGKEKQTHVVIGAPRTDDNVEVPEIREEYQTNFSSDLTDQKTGEALNVENVVINNVYYNLPAANNDGFDAKEQCLILNTSMDYYTMNKRIPADATVTADFGSWYNGLIIVVNGKGTIDIDYQTEGGAQLAVKIGEEEAKYYTADKQGRVQVPYDVATPQYVYIYNSQYTGDEKKAPARARAMAGKSWLKIYGMKVTPQDPTGIHNIFVDSEGRPVAVYDMNGRKVNNPGKGVYIVNGKKIMNRQ